MGHDASAPVQTRGAQEGAPVLPRATTVHCPSAVAPVATEQASHAPLHEPLQHTPSTQKFDAHWLVVVHVAPFANRGSQAWDDPQ